MKFKSHLYYEEKDQVQEALKALRPLEGSKIIYYKNGINQGDAFMDINKGAYYPGISIYKSATVSVNFGPNFKCPPTDITFRGVSIITPFTFYFIIDDINGQIIQPTILNIFLDDTIKTI